MDCPAFISLRASKCGKYLQVMQVCNQHNHEISENAIKQTPHYRKLTPDVKEEVMHLLSANIHRNEIIKYVQLRAGVQLIAKTINNFMSELKTHKKYAFNVEIQERIQHFLETNKTVLAINPANQHQSDEPLIEPEETIPMESFEYVLEPDIDSSIEENYVPLMEFDSTIEFNSENYDAVGNEDVDNVPDDIIESTQSSEWQESELKSNQNRCENCSMTKSSKSLQNEINNLRQMKRRLIRETATLRRKKCKLLNHLEQITGDFS